MKRCAWARDEPNISYHDREWGVPEHDDNRLFEFLVLEGAQAGLSWVTILKRRAGYRRAFSNFDPVKVSRYTEKDASRLLKDDSVIRNKLKIQSAINNAGNFLKIQEEFGTFDRYIWGFVDYRPVQNNFKNHSQVPATSVVSEKLSADLKGRGFTFVGPTICYALMQAIGMTNDHTVDCFMYKRLQGIRP